jgi:energy-coupling factor transporter ATP-binding protein EcfA2
VLTKLIVKNFKRFAEEEIELGDVVVFIGPNNAGKTTALQALALWEIGVKRWMAKKSGKAREKRPGVTLNRRDLVSIPIPAANLLWRDLHVRNVQRGTDGKQNTQNIRVEIIVHGITDGAEWSCGLEFDYTNAESLYCRPARLSGSTERMDVPAEATKVNIAYLPPMSGLSANEIRLDPGAINVRLGEGRTAEVLRNLCYQVLNGENGLEKWNRITDKARSLFGVFLNKPEYIVERGEISMSYQTNSQIKLDISTSGRGLQQTLLLLAHLESNPNSVLLLDEPDAHLEILRQRQMYQLLTDFGLKNNCQIISASHSEIILSEAAERDIVIAFLGKAHRINDRGSQLAKSLKEIGFDQYYQAAQTGWVLYLEGSTDFSILSAIAKKLSHPAQTALEMPFVHYVDNKPAVARAHFFGLREAKPDLVGFALFDNLSKSQGKVEDGQFLKEYAWKKREIENYLLEKSVLMKYARMDGEKQVGPLFAENWEKMMEESISQLESAILTLHKESPWGGEIKATDEFLDPLFVNFFSKLKIENLMRKSNYHTLVEYLNIDQVDQEIIEVLDKIYILSQRAVPEGRNL